jgi:hypothetical protein
VDLPVAMSRENSLLLQRFTQGAARHLKMMLDTPPIAGVSSDCSTSVEQRVWDRGSSGAGYRRSGTWEEGLAPVHVSSLTI